MFIVARLVKPHILDGILPVNLLLFTFKITSLTMFPTVDGMLLDNKFSFIENPAKSVRWPIELGIVPMMPLLGNNIFTTLPVLPPLHVTPVQPHTAEVGTPPVHSHPTTVDNEHRLVDAHRSHSAESGTWGSYSMAVRNGSADTSVGTPPVR